MNDLDLIVLGLLWREPLHVYHFQEQLKNLPEGWWSELGTTAWYHHFTRLENDGFIRSSAPVQEGNRPPRKVYTLTSFGENRLVEIIKNSASVGLDRWSLVLSFLSVLTPMEQASFLQERLAWLGSPRSPVQQPNRVLLGWLQALERAQVRWIRAYLEEIKNTF